MELSSHEVTRLLRAWSEGEQSALEKLMPLVIKISTLWRAATWPRERTGHTLSPTALVNEAYLRLVDSAQVNWKNGAHLLAMCVQLVRRPPVDWACEDAADLATTGEGLAGAVVAAARVCREFDPSSRS